MDSKISLTVNGREHTITTDPQRSLLDVLREELKLTGTKYGCGEARCGACSVIIDGKRVFSCKTPLEQVADKKVLTIEGLADGEKLHPVQEAFLAENAFQCGYCTPGMIMAAVALLREKPAAHRRRHRVGDVSQRVPLLQLSENSGRREAARREERGEVMAERVAANGKLRARLAGAGRAGRAAWSTASA